MTVEEMLKQLPYKRALYIKYKFNLWFGREKPPTEKEFLKMVDLKTMNGYVRWERTAEFKHITSIVLATKQAEDLILIYNLCKKKVENSNSPEPKDIDMLLKLQKEINLHKKEAENYFKRHGTDQQEEHDDLEL